MTEKNFTSGAILPAMIRFALPMLAALLLQAAYGAADLLIVGNFGDATGVSAVGSGSQVMMLVTCIIIGLTMGATVLIGQRIGEKRPDEAGAVDGVTNRWQELWYITLPSMRPQLMFGAVMQITAAFGTGDVSARLAGLPSVDYAAHTIVNHITDYGYTRFEMGYASAIAVILFTMMVGSNKLVQKMLRKVGT